MKIFWFAPTDLHRRDLDGGTVEYLLPLARGYRKGIARFRVHGDCVHKMAVDIVEEHPEEGLDDSLHVSPGFVEQIEEHPDQSVARFRLRARV